MCIRDSDGTGQISLDVQFLPDVDIPCPDCGGSRYGKEAYQIRLPLQVLSDELNELDGESEQDEADELAKSIDADVYKRQALSKARLLRDRARERLAPLEVVNEEPDARKRERRPNARIHERHDPCRNDPEFTERNEMCIRDRGRSETAE